VAVSERNRASRTPASRQTRRAVLDHVARGQSVMLATNEILPYFTIAFCFAAMARAATNAAVDMSKAGH
jgi:hypothetical protein